MTDNDRKTEKDELRTPEELTRTPMRVKPEDRVGPQNEAAKARAAASGSAAPDAGGTPEEMPEDAGAKADAGSGGDPGREEAGDDGAAGTESGEQAAGPESADGAEAAADRTGEEAGGGSGEGEGTGDDREQPASKGKRAKKRFRRRKKHRKGGKLRILVIVLILIGVLVGLAHLPMFKIQNVSVVGNQHVSDAEVKRLAEVEEDMSIFGINTFLATRKVKISPYIDKASLKRDLPSTVQIVVTEKEAVAQLATPEKKNKKKLYVAIDEKGRVMEISEEKMDVSYIKDIPVTKAKIKEKIKVKDERAYKKAMELILLARDTDMYFKRVTIDGRWAEACVYGDLLCRGRYTNMVKALEAGTLRAVVYRLYQQNVTEGTITVGDNEYCAFTPEN